MLIIAYLVISIVLIIKSIIDLKRAYELRRYIKKNFWLMQQRTIVPSGFGPQIEMDNRLRVEYDNNKSKNDKQIIFDLIVSIVLLVVKISFGAFF